MAFLHADGQAMHGIDCHKIDVITSSISAFRHSRCFHLNIEQITELFNAGLQKEAHVHIVRKSSNVCEVRSHNGGKETNG